MTKKDKTGGMISLPQKARQTQALAIRRPLEDVLSGIHSENTRRAYGKDVRDFFGKNDLTLDELARVTPKEVAHFRDELIKKGLKPSTVARKLSAVRFVFDQMVLRGLLTYNPAHPKIVKAPKKATVKHTDVLSWDEAKALLSSPNRAIPMGRRDYALMMLGMNCAFRRGEILSIQLEDLKTGPNGELYIRIRGKGEKERLVSYDREDVRDALTEYLKDRGDEPGFVFPGRYGVHTQLHGSRAWQIVKHHANEAGLFKKGIKVHTLRATFITFALEQGVSLDEIQKTVGHSRGETTLGYARDLEMIKSKGILALKGLSGEKK